jgi:hypothetical protein
MMQRANDGIDAPGVFIAHVIGGIVLAATSILGGARPNLIPAG